MKTVTRPVYLYRLYISGVDGITHAQKYNAIRAYVKQLLDMGRVPLTMRSADLFNAIECRYEYFVYGECVYAGRKKVKNSLLRHRERDLYKKFEAYYKNNGYPMPFYLAEKLCYTEPAQYSAAYEQSY